jgi:hypothetical protein
MRSVALAPRWRLSVAVALTLLVGSVLAEYSAVQTTAQSTDPGGVGESAYFAATGYRISQPALLGYFQHRGGVRTFGYPISSEFTLLGRRVQVFQRQVLELRADGSVAPVNLLDSDLLPVTRFDGLALPTTDSDLLAGAPPTDDPDYLSRALQFVDANVPDQWNDQPVNFHSTFVDTVSCAEAVDPDQPCDPALLPAFALEIWGLPTSQPTADRNNPDFVYQRFQRGVMHYATSTGLTQGLLLGDWFKRVLVGTPVAAEAQAELKGSPFLAQYAPNRPLGLARPAALSDTTLASAFNSDTLLAAQVVTATEVLPAGVAGTATSVAGTATAVGATQIALQSTQIAVTATALGGVFLPTQPSLPGVGAGPAISNPAPGGLAPPTVSPLLLGTPTTFVGCQGDEQMWFTPRKPYIGTHVDISVTSQRHHDLRIMRLTGPLDTGAPQERSSIFGWTWTWTVSPTVEGFFNWTFYADGLRPCITSGFPALVQVGSTLTPTATPVPSATPNPTSTITPTPTPGVPTISGPPGAANCGGLVTINGSNFGTPPASAGTTVNLAGPGTEGTHPLTIVAGSNTSLLVQLPTSGLQPGVHTLTINNQSGFATTTLTVNQPGCL